MNISPEFGDQLSSSPVSAKIKKWAESLLPFIIALVPTSIITVLSVSSPLILNGINLKIYDYYLLLSSAPASTDAPLIVNIDEKSLEEYGQWPWPRFLIAELLEKIRRDEPLAVGVDIMFPEPDRTSLAKIYKNIERHFDVNITEAQKIPEHLRDNDFLLADILRRGNFVASLYFTFGEQTSGQSCTVHPLNITTQYIGKATEEPGFLLQADGVICNLPIFGNAVNRNGFINVEADSDGILRRVPLLVKYQGKFYPHLSLATLIAALHPKTLLFKISQYGPSGLILDDRFIPLDQKGNLAVNLRAPTSSSTRAFEYVSAADLLNGKVPEKKFTNKIVFLGTSAVGLNDIHHMPGDYVFPGVEFHAHVVDNILGKTFLRSPQWATGAELVIIIMTGFVVAFLFFRFGVRVALLTFIISGIGLFHGSKLLFSSSGVFLSPLYPFLVLLLNFSLIYPIKLYSSERRRRKKKEEIALMQEAILEIITALTEARDQETGGHIRRTQGYIQIMAVELRKTEKYKKILTPEEIEVICKVAPLHDVGKIGVPDNILLKPGKLSAKEFEEIKKHTSYGKKIIEAALHRVGSNYFLEKALEIVYTHQEKWNGSGYPQGLSGEEIPLAGRIMAVADVYDALTSTRPYKIPVEHEEAVAIMDADSGTHFDPELIEVFLKVHERFRKISLQYAESAESAESTRAAQGVKTLGNPKMGTP
ncbi:MAG: CHASE2 domain-containing protein [Candidatus Electrothrix communis]|nr:MAG: CHASE2 domain-containing protein [Candidatus Electrothrix communis]